MSALLVGYARCSTDQQDLTAPRVLTVLFLLWLLLSGDLTGIGVEVCIAGLTIAALLLAAKVSVYVIALRKPRRLLP